MFRRQRKRQLIEKSAQPERDVFVGKTLGEADSDEEKELRDKVLGLEDDNEPFRRKSKVSKPAEVAAPAPAWEDTDDEETPSSAEPSTSLKQPKAKQSAAQLRQKLEKLTGVPEWSKLKWERDASKKEEKDSSSDESEEEDETQLWRTAMDFSLPDKDSKHLPKDTLQFKRCTNVNKEAPTKGVVRSVEFHPSAQVVLTAGADETLNLFQVDGVQNPKIQSIFLEKQPIFSAHFSTNGQEVIMGSFVKCFHYYDMIAGKVTRVPPLKGYEENSMSDFKVSPDGKVLVFKGRFGRMHIFSAKSKEWIGTLTMNGSVEDFAFSHDGSTMYSVGEDSEVYVWDMNRRCCIHRFNDYGTFKSRAVDVSANDKYISTGSNSGIVNIYKTDSCLTSKSPEPVKVIKNLLSPITKVKFNPTTEILSASSCCEEKAIRLIHLPSCRVFKNFPGLSSVPAKVYSVDFSLNSGYYATGTSNGKAYLFRLHHYQQF